MGRRRDRRSGAEQGVALIAAALAMTLLLAVGASLVLMTSAETAVASNFRSNGAALYAARAGMERTIAELRDIGDWTLVLNGAVTGQFTDGAPSGVRRLADGSFVNLDQVLSLANCARRTPCTDAQMNAVTSARPWGVNNPRWRLFTWGELDALAGPPAENVPFYVATMVADDGSENDGDPSVDGAEVSGPNPGKRVLLIRSEAFGPRGVSKRIEAVVHAYRMDELDPASPQRLHVRSVRELTP